MIKHLANAYGQAVNKKGKVIDTKGNCTIFNGTEVIEFETRQEYDDYLSALPKPEEDLGGKEELPLEKPQEEINADVLKELKAIKKHLNL